MFVIMIFFLGIKENLTIEEIQIDKESSDDLTDLSGN